jgi:hypothetical protein
MLQKVRSTYQGTFIPSAGSRAVLFGRGLDTSHGRGYQVGMRVD